MTGDLPSISESTMRKARKEHICCECRRVIHPKERYQEIKGCWSGEWATYKTCEPCADLRDLLERDLYADENIAFGYLEEAAGEAEMQFPPGQTALDSGEA